MFVIAMLCRVFYPAISMGSHTKRDSWNVLATRMDTDEEILDPKHKPNDAYRNGKHLTKNEDEKKCRNKNKEA